MADGDGIQFTVKEMLAQIDSKIDALRGDLSGKADRSDVVELRQKITAIDAAAVKRDGPLAAQIMANANRVTEVERELDRRKVLVDEVPAKADKTYVNGLKDDIKHLDEKLDDITRTVQVRLLTFAFAVALSAVGVALTLVLTVGGHHGP